MKRFFSHPVLLAALFFVLGAMTTWGIRHYRLEKYIAACIPDIPTLSFSQPEEVTEFQEREDDEFVYYDIRLEPGVPRELNTEIRSAWIYISAPAVPATARAPASAAPAGYSNAFPVPANVESSAYQVERHGDLLTLKFPKHIRD